MSTVTLYRRVGGRGERMIHPGSGRRKAPEFGKGRPLDEAAIAEVSKLLGKRPLDRDLLIEHLHLIQDARGCLSEAHLQALGELMGLSMAEVFETASFYAHFDIVLDGEIPPAPLTIRVCDSLSCAIAGAAELEATLAQRFDPEAVRVVRAPCMGRCPSAPVVEVGKRHVEKATLAKVEPLVNGKKIKPAPLRFTKLVDYRLDGGYQLIDDCAMGKRSREEVIGALKDSGLRGLGGAGFPAGSKWEIVRKQSGERLLAVNADEGEPGTFKDRHYLETDPHRFLEGVLVACWTCEIQTAYIYVRDEYPGVIAMLRREIAELAERGISGSIAIHVRRGAGAYICGEESAMLESIEGKRGYPRHKPPFPTEVGLFGKPTLAHNVETLYWVRDIVERGAEWFASHGENGRKGLRSFSVSGRVAKPGVKLAPAGITAQKLIDEHCGGMAKGHRFKAYLPGGASGGILPASKADIPLDFDTLQPHGCFIGSAAVIVLSDKDDMKEVALNLMRFFEDESCGQCSPCRVGTEKAVQLMRAPHWDETLMRELSEVMTTASICGLGQAAANPLLSVLEHFPDEVLGA